MTAEALVCARDPPFLPGAAPAASPMLAGSLGNISEVVMGPPASRCQYSSSRRRLAATSSLVVGGRNGLGVAVTMAAPAEAVAVVVVVAAAVVAVVAAAVALGGVVTGRLYMFLSSSSTRVQLK